MNIGISIRDWFSFEESNENLMLKYGQTDNTKYLSILVDRVGDDLYYFIASQADKDVAADICQQAWIKVIDNRHIYSQSGSFKSWLFQIARFLLIDEFRRLNRWSASDLSEMDLPDEEQVSYEDSVEQAHYHQIIVDQIKQLPFLQREALMLQQDGFSLREVSVITSADIETVKSRLRYAKSFIKKALKESQESKGKCQNQYLKGDN